MTTAFQLGILSGVLGIIIQILSVIILVMGILYLARLLSEKKK